MQLAHLARQILLYGTFGMLLLKSGYGRAAEYYQPSYGDPVPETWRWHIFPEALALGLQCLVEGSDGSIWFGTAVGVARYDSIEWKTYTVMDGLGGGVETLCAAPDGSLYAGGPWGLSRWVENQWRRCPGPGEQSLGGVRRVIVARDGSLWIASTVGAWHLDERKGSVLFTGNETVSVTNRGTFRVERLPDAVRTKSRKNPPAGERFSFSEVYEDRQGRVWLGTEAGEILVYGPNSTAAEGSMARGNETGDWVLYNETDGLVANRRPKILQLTNGIVWVVFSGTLGRANQFDGVRWTNTRLTDLGATDDCSSLVQTRDGALWIGCDGAICIQREGRWHVYEQPKAPIPSARLQLLSTSDGALWICGQNAEAVRFDHQTARWSTYQDLNFHWEHPDGTRWFLHRNSRVVRQAGEHWTRYGVEDGLIDSPTALFGTRGGEIWVAGSHQRTAACARFDGHEWERFVLENLSWAVDWRATLETSDGSLWFGASVDSSRLGRDYSQGLMRFDHGTWTHYPAASADSFAPDAAGSTQAVGGERNLYGRFYGLGQSRDGRLWGGGGGGGLYQIAAWKNGAWNLAPEPHNIGSGPVSSVFTSREGDLWVGSRQVGVFRFDGQMWRQFHISDGLAANSIRDMTQTADGSIWVASERNISRFDGHAWTLEALPPQLNPPRDGGGLKPAPSGGIWINRSSRAWNRRAWPRAAPFDVSTNEFWTVCYNPDSKPPRTQITFGPQRVAQPGKLEIHWTGTAAWHSLRDSALQYSFRLDGGAWSAYTASQSHSFSNLPTGLHRFEVRARDRDFFVDPQPARLAFTVLPPLWAEPWFLGLILLLLALAAAAVGQTRRLLQRDRHLWRTNQALATEIEERKRMEQEMRKTHDQLLRASHQAGMAEVATSVLHNVGNVLNSVNVSTGVVCEKVRRLKVAEVPKVARLLQDHAGEEKFLTDHPKGRMVSVYLEQLGRHLESERDNTLSELDLLKENVNHIIDIVSRQQQYSHLSGFSEAVSMDQLLMEALRLNEGMQTRNSVPIERELHGPVTLWVEKHKVLQILVNLLRNAVQACEATGLAGRQVRLRTSQPGPDRVQFQVSDNGVGIPPENLTRIFGQGFTTRKDGHGYGLHSAANGARELGGHLTVESEGVGRGATFTLELPVRKAGGDAAAQQPPAGESNARPETSQ